MRIKPIIPYPQIKFTIVKKKTKIKFIFEKSRTLLKSSSLIYRITSSITYEPQNPHAFMNPKLNTYNQQIPETKNMDITV